VIEGTTLAGTVLACDRAIKDATVALAGLRLTPGLGGRAWFVVTGHLHDVEASVAVARGKLGARLWRAEVIARPSPELLSVLLAPGTLSVEGGGWNKRA
jgi:microcompartment protein CcmL/EutN